MADSMALAALAKAQQAAKGNIPDSRIKEQVEVYAEEHPISETMVANAVGLKIQDGKLCVVYTK